jgi:hypothetical protein
MTRPSLVLFPVAAVLLALSGCGSGGAKQPSKDAVAPVQASVQARKELATIAKKSEGNAAYEAMETYIKKFEDPEQKWTWSDLDELFKGYNYETKVAYEKWRAAVIKEANKR